MKNTEKKTFSLSVHDIVEIGVLTSFAVVLDTFIKIPIAANGGSINFSIVPLLIISLKRGWFKGFIAGGIIFGFITCVLDGYGFASFPFDYLLGFGSVGIFGLFKNKIKLDDNKINHLSYLWTIIGISLVFVLRFIFSTISGVLIYGLDLTGSMIYQLTYLSGTYASVIFLMMLLLKPILLIYKRHNA